MEEIPLLLGNICTICYESASKEYLQKRWISCRIRRVFSCCCCSRHLIAESADALRELLRGGAAAVGGLEEERGRTNIDCKKIPERRGSVRSVHLQVACKPWLFAFSPSRCEASSPSAGCKQNGRAS